MIIIGGDGSENNPYELGVIEPESNSVESKLKEGDYVYYTDSKGTTRKCAVLWDANAGYGGVQIITMDIVENITLGVGDTTANGADDSITAMNSYNDAISTLNSRAETYSNSTYSSTARCVGSVPNNKNSQSVMHTTQFGGIYNKKLRDTDTNYVTDCDKMDFLGIKEIDQYYWLASRYVLADSTESNPCMRIVGWVGRQRIICNRKR